MKTAKIHYISNRSFKADGDRRFLYRFTITLKDDKRYRNSVLVAASSLEHAASLVCNMMQKCWNKYRYVYTLERVYDNDRKGIKYVI